MKLTDQHIRQLQATNTAEGMTLAFLQDQADLDRVHRFVVTGAKIENGLPAPVALASRLFRPNEYQKNNHRYGFSLEGSGMFGPSYCPCMQQPTIYQIRIKGHLDVQWAAWFEGLTITLEENGEMLLTGPVLDQAALHGLLRKVRDLGVQLISVNRVKPGGSHE